MTQNRLISLTAGVLTLALLAGLVFYMALPTSAPRSQPPELDHILLPDARELKPFSLMDMNGQPLDIQRLQGKWSFLFFGYTHCPDICPTTLSTLKGTARRLQQAEGNLDAIQFVFISVDPKRDSLTHLKDYISYFHPDFLAATGDKSQIDALTQQVGAIYMFDGDTNGNDYIVNHSASIALIDPQGRWVGRFNPPHRAAEIADDFRRVRNYFSQ